ncbi:MAG: carbohydrate ABC transporter permease, partial [Clostridia bacterium]|nr:carbohydrate ABC transporter permease [Clostridia bacterium]
MRTIVSDKTKMKIIKYSKQFIVKFLIFTLLVGLSYVVLYPFIFKILAAFMSKEDLYNSLVDIVPMNWTLENFLYIIKNADYIECLKNTLIYAFLVAGLSTASSALVGYGIAKFKFKGVKLLTFIVIIVMLMPIQTLSIPLYLNFRYFDPFGIISLFGGEGLNLIDTAWPSVIMSATSLGFRAGIFVILMRQYYIGVPDELIEAACVDGAGPYKTFFSIILPMAKSMLIVIFALSFAWQYTDTFYSDLLLPDVKLLPNMVQLLSQIKLETSEYYLDYVRSTTSQILAILPLLLVYALLQKKIIQGIERSGLVG